MTELTLPEGGTWHYAYDGHGKIIKETDPLGRKTAYSYTKSGELVSRTTRYTYDANGNLLTETDPLNQVQSYSYDSRNRLIETISAGGRREQYDYDRDSRIKGRYI